MELRDQLLATLSQTADEAAAARTYAELSLRRVVVAASRAGVSQREIAARIGRSQPEVHRMLRRTAPSTTAPASLRREERVQYELHRALAAKLRSRPDHFATLARANLARMRGIVRGELAHRRLDDWELLIEGPVDTLTAEMLRADEYGVDLRQLSPYAGALTEVERLAAIERALADAA